MRPITVPLLALSLAFPLIGQTTLPLDEKVIFLSRDLHAILRIADLGKELRDNRQVMLAMVDSNIESMREKRPDGTYRWAALQREEGGRVTEEKGVQTVQSEKDLQKITTSALNPYRVLIIAPRKRNLVSANNRVFVRNLIVDSTGFDGKTQKLELPVNVWINPGDTHGVALPEIGKSAIVTAEVGVESGNKAAVAQVAVIEAKLVDDPSSPYYPAIRRLLQLREIIKANDIQRGPLKTIADEALLAIPGEIETRAAEQQKAIELRKAMAVTGTTKGSVVPGDATPDVTNELAEIARLLGGTIEDQAAARARLQTLREALTATQSP
jgi:hypothetical protein